MAGSDGNIYREGKKISSRKKNNGYLICTLSIRGKIYTRHVHRLICAAFHGKSETLQTRHLDNIRINNTPENLQWSDKKTNEGDKKKYGTLLSGERVGGSKLKTSDIIKIREMARNGIQFREIAKLYPVTAGTISDVATGKRWKHIKGSIRPCDIRRKFTDAQIREIRALNGKISREKIAKSYGVNGNAIYQIMIRDTYKHVD